MFYQKPLPFIERADVFEVSGRIAADGSEVQAIDRDEVARLVEHLIEQSGAQTIAICLLHAYANPSHEQAVADVVREQNDPEIGRLLVDEAVAASGRDNTTALVMEVTA